MILVIIKDQIVFVKSSVVDLLEWDLEWVMRKNLSRVVDRSEMVGVPKIDMDHEVVMDEALDIFVSLDYTSLLELGSWDVVGLQRLV